MAHKQQRKKTKVRETALGYRSGATPTVVTSEVPPQMDFVADPEVVRVVVEGERLTFGHLFNPAFATEIARIVPLPHQRLAVYEHLLPQHRLRFLLADDAGAGKTIMTGLYIREMLSRRLISRVLIVAPAGLVGNWERELRQLFNLHFTIVSGSDVRHGNPFVGEKSDLLIVSVDTLAGERMFACLQAPDVQPYDLAVFDEAHKLAADRDADLDLRKTARYHLAEALAGLPAETDRWSLSWHCHHLLLLSATPHMGKDFPYYCLWRLLEPDALATIDAFNQYPADARRQHFLRRTKEEMVYFDGRPIYPQRTSTTHSYDLKNGEISEQSLYDATTSYIETYYNRAATLNRSAARLAMSVFQRRLASSTYALLRSFERRQQRLAYLIEQLRSGAMTPSALQAEQQRLAEIPDVFSTKTADEEATIDGQEENEVDEEQMLAGVAATSLHDLEMELAQVEALVTLAQRVYEQQHESKFEKLYELLCDPRYRNEKLIIFTEHRDTLDFLVHRLEGLGFTDQIAQIHGGMDYQQREEQVTFFRKPISEGGALYLVATDAAGEGINLQVCRLMVNYDIPWNPARLEQRMGRIHRFGQQHDVYIFNLVAGKTREGRVMQTLLEKLEAIRRELGSDKVFDVVGQLFEQVSLHDYMIQALQSEETVQRAIEGRLTKEQVLALQAQQKRIYGDGGEVKRELPRLRETMEQERFRHLLPGTVRRFLEHAAPLLKIGFEGDLNGCFRFRPLEVGSLDWLLPLLERYPPLARACCTVNPPANLVNNDETIFLHPGEPVFDRLRSYVCARFERDALRGAVFVDPQVSEAGPHRPYLFHLVQVVVRREEEPALPALRRAEVLETRLVGLKQFADGVLELCSPEHLLLLRGSDDLPPEYVTFAASAEQLRSHAEQYAREVVAEQMAQEHRRRLTADLATRQSFIRRSFAYQEAEMAEARQRLNDKVRQGDSPAKGELAKVKQRQQALEQRLQEALAVIEREPQLITVGPVTFLAHALVVPSSDPEDRRRYDADVEARAVQIARAYEESQHGAVVYDVSTPEGALAAGLEAWPGFDLLSVRPSGERISIEVKGRAERGTIELSENEFMRACTLRARYWLYAVFDCARDFPLLCRVQDPVVNLLYHEKKRILFNDEDIFAASETP